MRDDIAHDKDARRFSVAVGGKTAYLTYEMLDAGTMDATRTYTPPAARGQGIASRIVRAALDHARAKGWRVVATCWYVDEWIDRHEEYASLRAS